MSAKIQIFKDNGEVIEGAEWKVPNWYGPSISDIIEIMIVVPKDSEVSEYMQKRGISYFDENEDSYSVTVTAKITGTRCLVGNTIPFECMYSATCDGGQDAENFVSWAVKSDFFTPRTISE